ncbi:MAG TPA: hypothetical protein VJP77_03870 [Planctomycetota bacterium]|nr:hypothetical protein [Planctomycetota bacterium]
MRKLALALCLLTAACSSSSGSKDSETPEGQGQAGEAGEDGQEADFLTGEAERLSLAEQKQAILVEQSLLRARELKRSLQLEEAEQELLKALQFAPDDQEVKAELAAVGALLGRPAGDAQSLVGDLARRQEIRTQQLRAEAENGVATAKSLMARGDYDEAIAELQLALDRVRWAPADLDWKGVDTEAEALLAEARGARERSAEEQRVAAERESYALLQLQEEEERLRREERVANLIEEAIAAFEAESYDQAMDLSDAVLEEDPRNEQALDIRDAAFRAGREQVREDYVLAKREQFKRWEQDLRALRIANSDIVTLPSEEYWTRITELRADRASQALSSQTDPADQELLTQVQTQRIPGLIVAEVESLAEVVDNVRAMTGLPLVVHPAAEEAAFDAGALFEFNLQNPITVERALNLIADVAGEEVTWVVRYEAVLFTTREKARGQLVIMAHPIQDLVLQLTMFLGPRIDRLRLLDQLEDDDGGGLFAGVGEPSTLIQPETMEDLVRNNIAPGSWEDEGVSLRTTETGYIVVSHTPEVQRQVQRFLDDLRRFNSSLVTIESKFLTVADNFIQQIGVEWRGLDEEGTATKSLDDVTNGLEDVASLGFDNGGAGTANGNAAGNPGAGFFYDDGGDGDFKGSTTNTFKTDLTSALDPNSFLGDALTTIGGLTTQITILDDAELQMILRAVEKTQEIQLVNDQQLSIFNTQRAYVSVINERAYIQDFDVEVANFVSIADPVINVLVEGVVLEVQPTISQDRQSLRLELKPTVARVVALRSFVTSLGGTNTAPVEFELPELEVQTVATTATIPDGGSILIGGLSRVRNIERRAEVPWLADIPLLGFFFKEEGYNDEKESLMILIKAWITDVKEEMASLENG